tara:strand:+ start:255 stop:533 length:279 start_codon:yes stop_codon:yes gene_type:complete
MKDSAFYHLENHDIYQDTGCQVSPSCLRCPLPVCKFDDINALYLYQRQTRDAEVWAALQEGLTTLEVAERFGLTERTVYRIQLRHPREVEVG